jgi:hypothetical protein
MLYGCKTWSLSLREEHRLRALENRVLKKIFGPLRDHVTQQWRRLHNEELYNFCSSTNTVWTIKGNLIKTDFF